MQLAARNQGAGRTADAENIYRQIAQQQPGYADAHYRLGKIMLESGRVDQAIEAFARAIKANPNAAEPHSGLAGALLRSDRYDAALAEARHAVALDANNSDAWNNLGSTLTACRQFGAAAQAFARAVYLAPDAAVIRLNFGSHLLLCGDYPRGWAEYEWRWKVSDSNLPRFNFSQPLWNGQDVRGKTILLCAEQGFGDAIQFSRYASMVKATGARVALMCQPDVVRLLASTPGVDAIYADGVDAFDVYCPLMSLPRIFGTTLQNVPPPQALTLDSLVQERWERNVSHCPGKMKVGIVWAGAGIHKNDRHRSMRLEQLALLSQVPGVAFYSLQLGPAAAQTKSLPPGMKLIDWTSDIYDFADTAALIANLDLVIAVDTAAVHVAGTLGKPVWIMLHTVPDWRWQTVGERTPWYPSARLFRQSTPGSWSTVVEQVKAALQELIRV